MDQHVHMRTGWWIPLVFCIDGNHDVIPIKHHRWYSNIMIGSKLLRSKRHGQACAYAYRLVDAFCILY